MHERANWGGVVCLAATIACGGGSPPSTQTEENASVPSAADAAERPSGVIVSSDEATPGYVLFSPLLSDTTYLLDNDGLVVHTWKSPYAPQGFVYLRDNGNLLRGARVESSIFNGGGAGGRLEEYTWDGELVWSFEFPPDERLTHHDVAILPNGNLLAIAWERKTAEEARRAGRRAELVPEQGIWPGMIAELEPTPPEGAKVVWEWHVWDHWIQNRDESLPNYGDPATHPHRIDINGDGAPPEVDPEELERLKALGYVSEDTEPEDLSSDLLHINAVDYNAELDQIALSTPRFDEIWIIDHSTTTEEAAGSTGGRWGRGGDLLYRWGNASAYGRHESTAQQLYAQHDVRWIPDGSPGAGNLTIFNNDVPGSGEGQSHSTVVEIAPPVHDDGSYVVPDTAPFGPKEPQWTYRAPEPKSFFSAFISGAHRLPHGNTFICEGDDGRFFEITPEGEIVWEYWSRYSGDVRMADGSTPHPVDKFHYAAFRATKILPDDPALAGRDLAPLDPQPPAVLPHP